MAGTKFAAAFYHSAAWANCRKEYAHSVGGLCERCLKAGKITPGTQVHHKQHLTPGNLNNPEITLNWNNLELLCDECHEKEHRKVRWRTDAEGRITF
jgi:5-methylcytosine-specific restriction endonuclease McrA